MKLQTIFAMALLSVSITCFGAEPAAPATKPATSAAASRYLAAAQAAGDYLVRMIEPDGKFIYLYDPLMDAPKPGYNLLRHCGTIYAMLELYEVNRSPELLRAIEKPLAYMLKTITDAELPGINAAIVVDEEGEAKLGGNSLALLALTKHASVTGSRDHLPTMQKLARWMIWAQNPDGEFRVHQLNARTRQAGLTVSPYAPGQGVFSLARLYELDRNVEWLNAADKAASWMITVRDAKTPIPSLAHDHWLLYGLNDLHRHRPRDLWVEQTHKITLSIIHSQLGADAQHPDWAGAWYVPPRTTPVATRVEGLMSAYALFRDFGKPEEAAACLASSKRGIDFFLRAQQGLNPDFPNPKRAAGSIGASLTDPTCRIDFQQHAMSALLLAYHAEAKK